LHVKTRIREKLQKTKEAKKSKEFAAKFSHVSTKYYDSSNSDSENEESPLNVSDNESDDMIDYINN